MLDRYRLITIPSDVYQVSYLPFKLLPGDVVTVVIGAVVVCFLATLYPSRQAARLDPAQALAVRVAMAFVTVRGLNKYYTVADKRLHVLRDLDLTVEQGEMVAIMGASGRGEEHAAARARRPRHHRQRRGPRRRARHRDDERRSARGVPQPPHRLRVPVSSPAAGVHGGRERDDAAAHRARLGGRGAAEGRRVAAAASASAIGSIIVPGMLSGGEQQRVAVSRALVMQPSLLLADEPTGDLDEATADALHELLRDMHREFGLTAIIATHNPRLAAQCDRTLRLEGGRLS